MEQRPELGARLDHLCVRSSDPERAARFLEAAYAMTRTPAGEGWHCHGPHRDIVVAPGKANTVGWFAYALPDEDALAAYAEVLQRKNVTLDASPSPLFGQRAFSTVDPNGNRVAFGVRMRAAVGDEEPLPARLQHLAFRTPDIEAMVAFYTNLGFVVSDRVEDETGALRACFLRTDPEHHALALFGAPVARLDHISCETRDIAAIIGWADRMSKHGIPIHWGVGRHGPGNDVFFMVKDPDDNLIELSAELEICDAARPAGQWRHEPRTLNLWGTAIMRS
jgi:catechol 2,3-dioxygenase